MRFNITLHITSRNRVLPINYQYPLHSWIYKVIESADAQFSRFLHEEGYATGYKNFKLFTFSPLTSKPFKVFQLGGNPLGGIYRGQGPQEQRIGFYGEEVRLQISFLMDQAAEKFIIGLFNGQQFTLGDQISQVSFEVVRIEAQPRPVFSESMRYRCLSPVVLSANRKGKHAERRPHAQYLHPEDSSYAEHFVQHLAEKQKAVPQFADYQATEGWQQTRAVFRLLGKTRKKGVHIKQHTAQHTQVIGYQYDFELTAPIEIHEMAYYAGFGEKNSLGFGIADIFK